MSLLRNKSEASAGKQATTRRRLNDSVPTSSSSKPPTSQQSFRRNRTLTGSTSHIISSSAAHKAELASPRTHAHMLTKTRRKLGVILFMVLLAAAFVYILLTQLVAQVQPTVVGAASLSAQQASSYQQTVDNYYAARPVERFRFSLDERQLLLHIQSVHPEVERVKLAPSESFGEAELHITAREPIARWSMSAGRQYVDANGVVFERNYNQAPSLRIIDNSGLQRSNGQILASNRFLGFVGQAAGQIEQYGFTVRQVKIPAQTTRQIELRLKGSNERYIVSVDRAVEDQVEDIARVAKHLRDKDLQPNYVDVRVAGKAFYK